MSVYDLFDRLAIRDLIENWAVWRDAGDRTRFRYTRCNSICSRSRALRSERLP
jgi:hypothetical protein